MRKSYEAPVVSLERFEANEYVAACWGVGCDVDAANQYEMSHNNYDNGNISHGNNNCGLSGNQVIYDDNNDGTADRMVEVGTNGLGTLTCTIYTDNTYSTIRKVSSVHSGEVIFWTTSASDGRTWHHTGTVHSTVPGHPNRS